VNCNQFLADEGWLSYDGDDHDSLSDIDEETRAYSLIPGRFTLNLRVASRRVSSPNRSTRRSARSSAPTSNRSPAPTAGRCKRIVDGETVFDGDHDEIAPDLAVIPADGFDLKSGFSGKEAVFTEGPRNGMHKFENSLLYSTDADLDVEGSNLFDVTPTILDLMDVETDGDFDGDSL